MIDDDVLFTKEHKITIHEPTRVDRWVKIEGGMGVTIGEYAHVCSFAHLNIGGGQLIVGKHVAFASGCRILSGSNHYSGESMSSGSPEHMQVVKRLITVIENFAFIGAGAIVLPGLRIGRRAVVGAGAVVTKDVPDNWIVAGNPAVKIGERD
jgi:acetyltransferase-like isoleucine patch superfamily enzyme